MPITRINVGKPGICYIGNFHVLNLYVSYIVDMLNFPCPYVYIFYILCCDNAVVKVWLGLGIKTI